MRFPEVTSFWARLSIQLHQQAQREKIRRSTMDSRKISKLIHGSVRCPHCGKPAWVMATKGERANLHCSKCGMFEISVRKLEVFRL
ncbi:MAG: hypothetical protein ACETWO_01990 [Candidatus Hadarchaeaceae archaeon]